MAYLGFAVAKQWHTDIFIINSPLWCVFLLGTSVWPARAAGEYVIHNVVLRHLNLELRSSYLGELFFLRGVVFSEGRPSFFFEGRPLFFV